MTAGGSQSATGGSGRGRFLFVFAIAAVVLVLDQISKWLIARKFMLGEEQWLVNGVLMFSHVRNPGVAFGMFAQAALAWRLPFFLLVAAAAVWLLVHIFRYAGHLKLGRVALGLIVGGAIGNLVDRIRFGEVVDFIDVWIGSYHWPTFNIADSAITVGTGVLLYALWRAKAL